MRFSVRRLGYSFSNTHLSHVGRRHLTSPAVPPAAAQFPPVRVRVRFAPSPTGSLHIGGARTALFNWLLARKSPNGVFIVRVEDTDEARSSVASEQAILEDLQWMNLQWDEGPGVGGPHQSYRQSERRELYNSTVAHLLESGKAYRCFCSEQELQQQKDEAMAAAAAAGEAGTTWKYDGKWRDAAPADVAANLAANLPYVVRFKVPASKLVSIDDAVRGTVTWDANGLSFGDFIIQRSNGMPVYNFCVAVDDAAMEITHVIRAEEHLTNTVRQVLVLEALGKAIPTYAHCSLILGADKQKLSKRHGAMSVRQFRELGFVPAALVNYLAAIGWNDGTPKDIYAPEELIEAFDLDRVVKGSAVFDIEKLKWVNGQHLKRMPRHQLDALVLETFLQSHGSTADISTAGAFIDRQCSRDKTDIFVQQAVNIALKDMQLLTDAKELVARCLEYRVEETLHAAVTVSVSAPTTQEAACVQILSKDSFAAVVKKLIHDYDRARMPLPEKYPSSMLSAFGKDWAAYVKELGSGMHLSGKDLYHPIRLALTGRISGPDVGEQVALWHTASGVAPAVSLQGRVDALRNIDVLAIREQALAVVRRMKSGQNGN